MREPTKRKSPAIAAIRLARNNSERKPERQIENVCCNHPDAMIRLLPSKGRAPPAVMNVSAPAWPWLC